MNTERAIVRARTALDQWFVLVVIVLLAVSLFGAYATYSSAAEQTATETKTVEAWSTTGGFDHGATVERENEVFEVGSELTDRTTYFTSISPALEGSFWYTYHAEDGDVDASLELERVTRSVDEDGEEVVEHWRVNETLDTAAADSFEPGEELDASFSLDVQETANETDRIEESLGGSPGTVETTIVASVSKTGVVDGDPVDRTETYELVVDTDTDVYTVDGPAHEERPVDETEVVETERESVLPAPLGSTLLFVVSLLALGAVVRAKATDRLAPPEDELKRVRREYERETFDDWISRGSILADEEPDTRIELETLEGLVDVAIDSNGRVIETDDDFVVVDGETLYAYAPSSGTDEDGEDDSGGPDERGSPDETDGDDSGVNDDDSERNLVPDDPTGGDGDDDVNDDGTHSGDGLDTGEAADACE
ncbi:DUF5305 domain-containing protein [Natrarchaeobaculum aegyptiacum]|uniref:DUF5305 domain-containing protein n=1 Tax=Natrarchaeobaculum aegyptiacum TaxID=745377 RepID=A0A2Z2HSZ1_9EURY|nr:DUF5305 domain-containing protein [Natrarchaeobaculum aegyptiacum]ARS90300.1 hypothetical protein B1756_11580 [Natrarchaeobaculum aegyptiacum]